MIKERAWFLEQQTLCNSHISDVSKGLEKRKATRKGIKKTKRANVSLLGINSKEAT